MLSGGCYCGAIRYETPGPVSNQALCHCSMCRGVTGAPCVAWFTVPRGQFRILAGKPARYRASGHATRGFCPACGTQLSFADDNLPAEIDITTCSLDDPSQVPPRQHIFTESQVGWLVLGDSLPTYVRGRADA